MQQAAGLFHAMGYSLQFTGEIACGGINPASPASSHGWTVTAVAFAIH